MNVFCKRFNFIIQNGLGTQLIASLPFYLDVNILRLMLVKSSLMMKKVFNDEKKIYIYDANVQRARIELYASNKQRM